MDLTHAHLLLNHVPTVGFVIGLMLFVISLIAGNAELKRASLVIFVGIALVTLPTYVTGNAAVGSNATSASVKRRRSPDAWAAPTNRA